MFFEVKKVVRHQMDIQKLKFPIGEYVPNKTPAPDLLNQWISDIETFPSRLRDLCAGATSEQLEWRYRPGGWTAKQVIHHCADSHINSIMRFKLALTEDTPTIRPYFEDRWAELADSHEDDIECSLQLLTGLHKRWVILLRSLTDEQLNREFVHPEHGKQFNLRETIGNYAWHCNHHLAHVRNAFKSEGKYE